MKTKNVEDVHGVEKALNHELREWRELHAELTKLRERCTAIQNQKKRLQDRWRDRVRDPIRRASK